ncbi:tol-pal system YbgF family protein [Myxococcota bacterium]
MVWKALLLSGVVALFSASTAHANTRQAKRYFKKAETHYKLGRFEDALEQYSKAYEAKPLPGFLFNIAQCHMELRHYKRALFFYEGYLQEKPRSPNRELVEERMTDARSQLATSEAQARSKEEAPQETAREEEAPKEEPKKQEQERDRIQTPNPALTAVQPPAPAPGEASFYETWWFWTIVGGITAAGTTAILLTTGGETRRVLPSRDLETIDGR